MGLARLTGAGVATVRVSVEVAVLAIGWLLGGNLGLGTAVFALLCSAAPRWPGAWGSTAWKQRGLQKKSHSKAKYVELNISTFQKSAGKSSFPVQHTFCGTRFARLI